MSNKHMYSTQNLTDKELKEQGNKYYAIRKYDDAVNSYTKAIVKNPHVNVYFTNRALCYLKLLNWESAASDCRRALELDSTSVKAHFFLGQALMELANYDESVKHLQRALDLSRDQKTNFGDDISQQLRAARKKRFSVQEDKRIMDEIALQTLLNKLLREDADRQLADNTVTIPDAAEIERKYVANSMELNDLFAKLDERRRKRDVPDYLCGKISFEILQDPVITPSGITYERKDIEEHLQRVGHFDPVTRVKLTQDQLIPNFAMKEVVAAFLQDNEWALDY